VSSMIENGFVHLPTEAEWLATYLHEITSFPNSKYDDQTDSTSQALDWVKARTRQFPLLQYFRRQALESGLPIPPSLIQNDELEAYELGRRVCLKCENSGPAQYGRKYHCNRCGNEWLSILGLANDASTRWYDLPGGERLLWDEYTGLWVDPVTGDTHAAGDDSDCDSCAAAQM
jgi:hypothetical protein